MAPDRPHTHGDSGVRQTVLDSCIPEGELRLPIQPDPVAASSHTNSLRPRDHRLSKRLRPGSLQTALGAAERRVGATVHINQPLQIADVRDRQTPKSFATARWERRVSVGAWPCALKMPNANNEPRGHDRSK